MPDVTDGDARRDAGASGRSPEPSAASWFVLAAGYGVLIAAVGLASGTAVTRIVVGPRGGSGAVVLFLLTVCLIGVGGALAGGPTLLRLERRLRQDDAPGSLPPPPRRPRRRWM